MDGGWEYVKRVKEGDELTLNIQERKAFMRGDKLVALVSEAASSGISLHADRRAQNQRRRVHITLQLPWAADQAVQQMGRSHRANQSSAPEFKFFMSSLGGEYRFASAVASRLQALGALTRGDRRAAGTGGTIIQSFAIDSKYGRRAVAEVMSIVLKGTMADGGAIAADTLDLVGQGRFDSFCRRAGDAMRDVGLVDEYGVAVAGPGGESVRNFLNRLLGIPVDLQDEIFALFSSQTERLVARAKAKGEYLDGICDVAAANISLQSEERLFECPRTGAAVVYCKLQSDRGVSFEEAQRLLESQRQLYTAQLEAAELQQAAQRQNERDGRSAKRPQIDHSGFYVGKDRRTGGETVVFLAIKQQHMPGVRPMQFYHIIRPHTGHSTHVQHHRDFAMLGSALRPVPDRRAKALVKRDWDDLYNHSLHQCLHVRRRGAKCPAPNPAECGWGKRVKPIHLFTGLVLPFWRDLQRNLKENLKVIRVQTSGDGGDRKVGIRVLNSDKIEDVKDIFRRGIQGHVPAQLPTLVPHPLYAVVSTLRYHACLNPSGIDRVSFELPAGWDRTAAGESVLCTAVAVALPYQVCL